MQTSESTWYLDDDACGETGRDHPAGRVTLTAGGALGLRTRLLSASRGGPGHDAHLTFPTMTDSLCPPC